MSNPDEKPTSSWDTEPSLGWLGPILLAIAIVAVTYACGSGY